MKRIGVKYCGGCNPQIERSKLVDELREELAGELQLVFDHSGDRWEIAVLVCGCPAACADRPEVRSLARYWVVVGGQMVEGEAVPETELPERVALKIKAIEGRESS